MRPGELKLGLPELEIDVKAAVDFDNDPTRLWGSSLTCPLRVILKPPAATGGGKRRCLPTDAAVTAAAAAAARCACPVGGC